jgi:hypothetical protein
MHFIYIFNVYAHQGLVPCVQKAVAPELRETGGRERFPPIIITYINLSPDGIYINIFQLPFPSDKIEIYTYVS